MYWLIMDLMDYNIQNRWQIETNEPQNELPIYFYV